jgi:hypothetical protein
LIDTDQEFTIKGNSSEFIHGNKQAIIHGSSKEYIYGTKTSTVIGKSMGNILGGKMDHIFPWEHKVVVGFSTTAILGNKNDLLGGARVEIHRGPHFKFGPTDKNLHSVRKKKIADDEKTAAKEKEVIGMMDKKVGEAKEEIGKEIAKVAERTEQIGKESVKVGDYEIQIGNLKRDCKLLHSRCGQIETKSDANFKMVAGGMMDMATAGLKMACRGDAKIKAGGPLDFQGAVIKLG